MSLWNGNVPLQIYNNCPDTLWPAIYTSSGGGPSSGGFELAAGANRSLEVASSWYGRGNPPATLAEFNLAGGVGASQNFIDISLVDGYNIPVGLTYIADPSTNAPPANLVSPSCIATTGYLAAPNRTGTEYTNETYPMPYESSQTSKRVGHWCPWSLQTPEPTKPGNGVFPYPDDNVARPVFDPCLSACHSTGRAQDCCTGDYDTPDKCPRSKYSRAAKEVCPDAYSYPYDDTSSTFVIPGGGGWSVTFCPLGRSTDILGTFGSQISQWAASGVMSEDILAAARNETLIEAQSAAVGTNVGGVLRVLVIAAVASVLVNGL